MINIDKLDARSRAWRTLAQGLGIAVATAIVGVLATAVGDIEWTRAYWVGVGVLAANAGVQAAVAYAHRLLAPPNV